MSADFDIDKNSASFRQFLQKCLILEKHLKIEVCVNDRYHGPNDLYEGLGLHVARDAN